LFYLFLSDIIFVLKSKSFCFFWDFILSLTLGGFSLKHVSIISIITLCCISFNMVCGLFNSNFIFKVLLVCNSVFSFCVKVYEYNDINLNGSDSSL